MDYVIYFIITIGILVFVHEFGHFAAAKLCGMRADVFAIGFGKRLFGWNKINGFTFGDLPKDFDGGGHTDYRLSLLPLGGYVKIAGMVDESFDTKFANEEPQPYEFRAKPTWQKVIVISAGVFMNFVLAMLVFWGIRFFQGENIIKSTTIGYVAEHSIADSLGFKQGDKVLSINGNKVNDWQELNSELLVNNIGDELHVNLLRKGKQETLDIPWKKLPQKATNEPILSVDGLGKPLIAEVVPNSPAEKAGLKSGDLILKLNNQDVNSSYEATQIISSHKLQTFPVEVLRDSQKVDLSATPGKDGILGIQISQIYHGKIERKTFGFFESFKYGWQDIVMITELTFKTAGKVIKGEVAFRQTFTGPIGIAKYATKSAETGIVSFLRFLALLSLSLAILNIMPFPVLDGGHLVIILIEGAIKREIPIKIKLVIQNTGLALLLLLMAFIIYNDILNLY